MALLKKWRDMAYSETADKGSLQKLHNFHTLLISLGISLSMLF